MISCSSSPISRISSTVVVGDLLALDDDLLADELDRALRLLGLHVPAHPHPPGLAALLGDAQPLLEPRDRQLVLALAAAAGLSTRAGS